MKLVGSAGCDIQGCLTLQNACEALRVSVEPDTAVHVGQVQEEVSIPGPSPGLVGIVMEHWNPQQL